MSELSSLYTKSVDGSCAAASPCPVACPPKPCPVTVCEETLVPRQRMKTVYEARQIPETIHDKLLVCKTITPCPPCSPCPPPAPVCCDEPVVLPTICQDDCAPKVCAPVCPVKSCEPVCSPCAPKCDPCHSYGWGSGFWSFFIFWIVIAIIVALFLYIIQPDYVLNKDANGNVIPGDINAGRLILSAIVIALILAFILYLIWVAVC